jgi:subtilase family serine protease
VDGETHFANASAPSIPAAFAGVVGELRGLDDFRPKPPRAKVRTNPDFDSANGAHFLAPDDLATIYDIAPLFQAGYNGAGQTLAIAGQTAIAISDIRGFRTTFNLPASDPQLVLYGTDPGVSPDDQIEADLDLEWSGAVARNAKIVYVYSQNVFESVQYAIDQNIAPVISVSYGGCEAGSPASYRTIAQQANAQGITWMNAAGDSGAAGCDWGVKVATHGPSVVFPADIPEVTAVGGTEFNEGSSSVWSVQNGQNYGSALSYIPEEAWNDTVVGGRLAASGGGASALFAKPWWQAGPGVPADQARDVPDVALSASGYHDAYVIFASGGLMGVGGTSAATPSFAGMVTLINQYVVAKGSQSKPGLGNINPNLYGLAQNTTGVFHDITVGNNIVPCTTGTPGCTSGSFGYNAGPGYDMVTGLGSVDANNLATHWAAQSTLTGTTTTLSANPASIAQSATTQLTATVTPVIGTIPPTGSVAFGAGTASLGSVALTASGSLAKAVLTVKGSSLTPGSNTIEATYSATGNFSNSTGSAAVNMVAPVVGTATAVAASPASIAAAGTTVLTATVKAASGSGTPTGSVTFAAGNASLGTAALAGSGATATAALTVKGSSLAAGNNSVVATYAGSSGFSASTSPAVTVNVAAPLVSTTLTVAASPGSIAQSASTVLTATVKAASGNSGPSGTVSFTAGDASLGTASLGISGTNASAALTVKGVSLATGNNVITATYSGNSSFAGSTATVTVNINSPLVGTTTAVTASPASIGQNAATQLTATVKPASGTATPTGSVAFALGTASLGTATLSASGTAAVTVNGSSLAAGSNTINASYTATGNFSGSTASVIVTVTPAPVTTTTTVTASPAAIAQSAATVITALVKAATGSAAPSGIVTFTSGKTTLGSATLTSSGATATAALTVKGSSLATGNNTITAIYGGSASLNSSTGSLTVGVSAATASNVVVSVAPNSISQSPNGWAVTVRLQETAGVATRITGFTINGTSFTSEIPSFFGTSQLAVSGTLASSMQIQWKPLPATIVFAFTGVDASGRQWSQSLSVPTTTATVSK